MACSLGTLSPANFRGRAAAGRRNEAKLENYFWKAGDFSGKLPAR